LGKEATTTTQHPLCDPTSNSSPDRPAVENLEHCPGPGGSIERQLVLPEVEDCRRSACRSLVLVTVSANHLEPAAHQRPLLRLSVTLDARPTACTLYLGRAIREVQPSQLLKPSSGSPTAQHQQRNTSSSLGQVRGSVEQISQ
jgi:hypothetical protein